MKQIIQSTILALFIALAPATFTGCATTEDEPIIQPIPQTKPWSQGRILTFDAKPTPELAELLEWGGAVRKSDKVFVFEKYDRLNDQQGLAVEAALNAGATMTGTPTQP